MNPTDLSDATARALDILPPEDSARSDPRLLRDPQLAEEARGSRDTAAAVWLAVSPLRVAPPDVLQEVMKEIQSPMSMRPASGRRPLPWLAVSGWAAAVVLAISLWPEHSRTLVGRGNVVDPVGSPTSMPAVTSPATTLPPRDARLRSDITRLQDRLASLQDDSGRRASRVISLSAPGSMRRTEDELRLYVHKLLTDALRSALEATSGAPSDPASLVIERGWLAGGLPVPEDGGLIRHRNFPARDWQKLGLFRAANGSYFDELSQTIWSPDPEGRGFIGRKINTTDDLAIFTKDLDKLTPPQLPQVSPAGFLIENSAEKTIELLVENVPPIPPGKQLVVSMTHPDGTITDFPLTPSAAGGTSSSPGTPPQLAWNSAGSNYQIAAGGNITFSNPRHVHGNDANVRGASLNAVGNASTSATADSASSTNIVGFFNNGSLIINLPSDTLPGAVQLGISDIIPAGQPAQVIVKSEP